MPVCKQIDMSSGFISSVSRRMTTLIFGGGGSGASLNRNNQVYIFFSIIITNFFYLNQLNIIQKKKNLKSVTRYKTSSEIFLLVDKNLQKWKINNDNTLTVYLICFF